MGTFGCAKFTEDLSQSSKMASGVLYTYQGSFRAAKILIAAEYSGTQVTVDKSFEFGKTNTSEAFLKKFPLGRVPAYEAGNVCLHETDSIAWFVANEQLRGKTNVDQALVNQYVAFSNNEITPSACTWTFPTLGFKQYNKQETENAKEHLKKCFTMLNNLLLNRTFLVGERVTLADISLCCDLVMLYQQVLDPKFREPYGNLNRWFVTCINQPEFKKLLGDIKLCETMAQFDNKKYQEYHPKDQKKGKGAEKKAAPKKEQPKKETPKKVEKEEEPPAPKEKKDPYADFPKPSMNLDEWKRTWSNKSLEESTKWFWDNIDKENYSVWFGEYEDQAYFKGQMDFMLSNLAGGMLQRLEGLRKNVFGVVCIHGDKPNKEMTISNAFLCRGQELAFNLNEDWNVDAPSYVFRKMDWNSEEDKKLWNKFLAEELHEEEAKNIDSKNFK